MPRVTKGETKPAEYSQALLRILGANPTLTINELAKKLAKSPKWLSDRLSITKLHEKIQGLVNENKVNLSNAYALAKLKDTEEQLNFLDRAMTETPQVFVPLITNRVREINDARRKGRDASGEQYVPISHLRKLKEMEEEVTTQRTAETLKGKALISNISDFMMGVKWALHTDPDSIVQAKATWESKKKERDEKKKEAKIERAKKAQEEAAKILAEVGQPAAAAAPQELAAVGS